VLHVDLDQFIAAVEVLRRPELRGRPVIVGGDGDPAKRGVVSTASYEAREYGVHSGLPLRTAARRCPDAVFLPVDRDVYEAASRQVMDALRSLGVVVEVLGWDEAFLAVDGDDPEAVAGEVRDRVRAATGLECTVPYKGARVTGWPLDVRFLDADVAMLVTQGGIVPATHEDLRPENEIRAVWIIARRAYGKLELVSHQSSPIRS
jgi:uncharacterized protein (TIGR02246 family)